MKNTCFIKIIGLLFASIFFTAFACNKKEDVPQIKDISFIATVKSDLIKEGYRSHKGLQYEADSVLERLHDNIKYDIEISRVTYTATDPFGEVKTLSGLVICPVLSESDKDKKLKIVSVQHGTLSSESEAPSLFDVRSAGGLDDILLAIPAAHANGYIVVVPDYFGYGADGKNPHYYESRTVLAASARRLIEAMPSFANQKSLNISTEKLFLFGYSEGGFATMSTLKSFSEKPSSFNDYITVAGAGAYDKLLTAKDVIRREEEYSSNFTASYLWVLLTYNSIYGINRDLNQLLNPDIEPKIRKYIGTDKIMQDKTIPKSPARCFSLNFTEGIINETDIAFVSALKDNDVSDFDALGLVELVHGTADTWVPTLNTDSAYVRLQRRNVKVNRILFEGGTHSTSYIVFVQRALKKL